MPNQTLSLLNVVYWNYLSLEGDSQHRILIVLEAKYSNGSENLTRLTAIPSEVVQDFCWSRCLTANTQSDASIQFLKSKFSLCQTSHQRCRQKLNFGHVWHPSRLLEVGSPQRDMLYLRDRCKLKACPYFTLSHCWGGLKPIQLTAASEASLKAGVAVSSLPKTFRDAVFICNEFNVTYLWIDSMCIFQDNINDWHKEAAAMRNVYSHAICNIAATAASNASVGLFFERDPMRECPFWVQTEDFSEDNTLMSLAGRSLVCSEDQWKNDIETSPLNRRAWVLQERFLSVRIMHFARSQVFWECLENRSGEVFPESIPEWAEPDEPYQSQKLKLILSQADQNQDWRQEIHLAWQSLLSQYSRCRLSEESDKLVAINGIVQQVSTATGDKFIGGLWESRFLLDLCWRSEIVLRTCRSQSPFRPQKWRAPTWSWAAQDVEARPSDVTYDIDSPNLQSRVTIQSVDIGSMGSGQLQHASLTLHGKVVYATVTSQGLTGMRSISIGYPDTRDRMETWFESDDHKLHVQEHLVCLAIWAYDSKNPKPDSRDRRNFRCPRYFETLVLRPRESGVNHYERVGTAMFSTGGIYANGLYEFYAEHESEEMHTVVIF